MVGSLQLGPLGDGSGIAVLGIASEVRGVMCDGRFEEAALREHHSLLARITTADISWLITPCTQRRGEQQWAVRMLLPLTFFTQHHSVGVDTPTVLNIHHAYVGGTALLLLFWRGFGTYFRPKSTFAPYFPQSVHHFPASSKPS